VITVFSVPEGEGSPTGARRGLGDFANASTVKASQVAVSTLQASMQGFLAQLGAILSTAPQDIGGMTLDEVQIHAQIDGEGNVGIAGIFGAKVSLEGGMKFVLRKKTT